MQNFLAETKHIIYTMITVLVICFLLIVTVNLIPTSCIHKNVDKTAKIMFRQGNAPIIGGSVVENFSDADAIAITYNKEDEKPFYYALYAYNYYIGNHGANRGVGALKATVDKLVDKSKIYEHSQEWHGYQIWLKPLLCFTDINVIRILTFSIVNLLAILLCIKIVRNAKNHLAFLPFCLSFLAFNYSFASLSFLLATDITIGLIGSYLVIKYYNHSRQYRLWMYIGAIASYFSMANMPMVTVGLPLVTFLSIATKDTAMNFVQKFKALTIYSFSWLLGYSILTFSKIIITKLLLGAKNGVFGLKWYTGMVMGLTFQEKINLANSAFLRITHLNFYLYIISILILTVLILGIYRKRLNKKDLGNIVLYLIVALIPYIWSLVMPITCNIWWTTILYAISMYSILQMIFDLCAKVFIYKNDTLTM